MARPDIIVVGASAGGVEALKTLVAGLPADLPASIFVVLHIGGGINGQSYLPEILSKAGPLPAVNPRDGQSIEQRRIYIAPPNCHLLLEQGYMQLSNGPKENRTRPAINPLFRSAARAYDGRVTGVILTGLLDDGVAGLAEIKRSGGLAVVEDPATALFPSMPTNALRNVEIDHVSALPALGGLLAKLAVTDRNAFRTEEPVQRKPSNLTCPECRGPLEEERQGKIIEYRCRVGHAYSLLAMKDHHNDTVERSLWAALVALEEAVDIADRLANEVDAKFAEEAHAKRAQATQLQTMLHELLSAAPRL